MPSEEATRSKLEALKTMGNECFQKGQVEDAIQAYRSALDELRKLPSTSSHQQLQATLLSNRAACRLKQKDPNWDLCIQDCTAALELLDGIKTNSKEESSTGSIRCKLLYRRAKARFMLDSLSSSSPSSNSETLNNAAKDVLTLLSIDKDISEAASLLQAIRAKHGLQQQNHTPVAKTLNSISSSETLQDKIHHLKVILGLLTNDVALSSMELGRRGGVALLMKLATTTTTEHDNDDDGTDIIKCRTLALQVLSCACSHPPFVRSFCGHHALDQRALAHIVSEGSLAGNYDEVVAAMSVMLRLVLHLDRDSDVVPTSSNTSNNDEATEISSKSDVDGLSVCRACVSALESGEVRVIRAALDVLSSWTATDREGIVHAAIENIQQSWGTNTKGLLPHKATEEEVRAMKPRELAAYRRRERERHERDKAWAKSRALLFCDDETGGLTSLLRCAVTCPHHGLRREIGIVLGRLMTSIDDESDIKKVVVPVFGCNNLHEETKEYEGLTIEEIDSDEEEEKQNESSAQEGQSSSKLETMMEKGQLTSSLLLGKPEVGAWALGTGWSSGQGVHELKQLMLSKNNRAMFIASEVLSAAASVEKARPFVSSLIETEEFQELLQSEDKEIQSGAASAIGKLGLSDKNLSSHEGEVMGLLEVAVQLLNCDESQDGDANTSEALTRKKHFTRQTSSSVAAAVSTAVDRGIELLGYLVTKTQVKEELAHGFRCPGATSTALERLVELASKPHAGESLSTYGLATIFNLMAVSVETLRKEAFIGKEMTAEQYDELQALGKTEEEKELAQKTKEPEDTPQAIHERIRKMASCNVPRAMVNLMDGASESALEQLVIGMNRIAIEESVRGAMVQQGVLSACIKLEQGENPSDKEKSILRQARQCIGKLLVTTNPVLLTVSQRMGAIKPLIQLIRDHNASDLQQFEALLAITNIASMDDATKNRIVAEKGIATLSYAMFSDHGMVRRAATEAMCNLVGHPDMAKHLADPEKLRLWVAFASDYEENFECARAAVGCLAMATQDSAVATALVGVGTFKEMTMALLESGNLELMHRVLVMILNLLGQGDTCHEAVVEAGLVAFCRAYVESYHDGNKMGDLNFSDADKDQMTVTVDLAKQIVKQGE